MFWPAFSVVKYAVVPAKGRSLVGVLGEIIWGVCLSFSCVACMYCQSDTAIADTASQTGVWIMAEQHSQWGRNPIFLF